MTKNCRQQSFSSAVAAFLIAVFAWMAAGCGSATKGATPPDTLSLEMKAGQRLMIGFDGTAVTPELSTLLRRVHPGGVILFSRNVTDAEQVSTLIRDLQEVARADTGQPLLVAVDQEGGQVRRLTWLDDATAQADIAGSDQAYELGKTRGAALASLGINLNLAPVLDVGSPGDFLYKHGRLLPGNALNIGALGFDLAQGQADGGIFTALKHFPGYGGITYDPETEQIPVMPDLPETSQFSMAMLAEPEFVMTANVVYSSIDPALPFSLSPAGISYLRDSLSGDYLVVTDDLASPAIQAAFTLPGAAVLACRAGADVLLVSSNRSADVNAVYERLLEAVRNGEISKAGIDETAARITDLKSRLSIR